jgi:hypothetical protein
MPFANKDLLVSVLPKLGIGADQIAKICLFRTYICRFPTWCFHATCLRWGTNCGHCSFLLSITGGGGGCGFQNSCGPGGSACDPTIFCAGGSDPFVIEDLEDLVTIRGELRATLAKLDEIEKGGLQSSLTNRADADALERQLSEALDHVRKRKEGLK